LDKDYHETITLQWCHVVNQSWPELHIETPISCSKSFESESGFLICSNLVIRLLFRLRQLSMQPKFSNIFTWEITFIKAPQTPATAEDKKW